MDSLEAPQKQLSDEAQLLKEGKQLARRAVELSTQTHKIKIWVPILCSMILTGYYLYGLHKKQQASGMDLGQPATPAVVAENDPSIQKTAAAPVAEPQPDGAAPTPSDSNAGSSNADDSNADFSNSNLSNADLQKQAQQAHAAQRFGEEAKLWQQYMAKSPLPQTACPAIGKAYERASEVDLAVQALEKCVSLEPGNVDTKVAFAHVLETKRDFARAATLYREVLAKDPKNLDAQTGTALLELKQDHLHEAEQAALNVLHKAPDQTDALLIAGIVAWRESRLPDAERMFLRGAALDDQRADFHAFLGRIAEAQRRPQEALRQYDRALALDPSDSDIAEHRTRLEQAR